MSPSLARARGSLSRIARCPRCGAWTYAGTCATPHERVQVPA